jgi:ATP-binding cassette, subfamily B, bacterial PglK
LTPIAPIGELLHSLWRHLSARRRRQFFLLLLLMFASVFAEVLTLSAIVPFIGILASPEAAFRHPLVAAFARLVGARDAHELIVPLTAVFSVATLFAALVRLALVWASTRFTFATGADLSRDVYRRTLHQPYEVHLRRGSSEVISGIATKIGSTMLGVVLPVTVFLSQTMLLLSIIVTLLIIDPFVAMISAVGFGASYALVTWVTNGSLRRNSRFVAAEQTLVVKALQEGLGGIRDVLLDNTQAFYCGIYERADRSLRRAQGTNVFISQSPRPVMEAFGMLLITALAFSMSQRPGGIAEGFAALAALALGAQRLLPALQATYTSWASIVGTQGLLADTIALLDQPFSEELLLPPPAPLRFQHEIRFEGVRFRYATEGVWAVDGLDLRIPRGARIGFVGGTGGGKSTTMDLLMGLIKPVEGRLLIDGEPLDAIRTRAWQRTIAHVPQTIYLTDASVAENIAFGIDRAAIDMDRVREAARRAHIAEFIESGPLGYGAIVGERGVRLSGGQRQRIGIARALYKQASILVLDEATSALDNLTESMVMEAIEQLDRGLTILVIAHRLTTVRRCDCIVQVEGGRVAAQGTYDELYEQNPAFRQLARAVPHS